MKSSRDDEEPFEDSEDDYEEEEGEEEEEEEEEKEEEKKEVKDSKQRVKEESDEEQEEVEFKALSDKRLVEIVEAIHKRLKPLCSQFEGEILGEVYKLSDPHLGSDSDIVWKIPCIAFLKAIEERWDRKLLDEHLKKDQPDIKSLIKIVKDVEFPSVTASSDLRKDILDALRDVKQSPEIIASIFLAKQLKYELWKCKENFYIHLKAGDYYHGDPLESYLQSLEKHINKIEQYLESLDRLINKHGDEIGKFSKFLLLDTHKKVKASLKEMYKIVAEERQKTYADLAVYKVQIPEQWYNEHIKKNKKRVAFFSQARFIRQNIPGDFIQGQVNDKDEYIHRNPDAKEYAGKNDRTLYIIAGKNHKDLFKKGTDYKLSDHGKVIFSKNIVTAFKHKFKRNEAGSYDSQEGHRVKSKIKKSSNGRM